ncbi:MAG: DUF2141 domain-containing protein [Phaeodactylibacter sp.]|uniref:DUF2141 domain-containing protein n=1 Tax=Phaeodactylibacter sp. TaxID=1940289 RepID=UPI0032ECD671
MNTMLGILFVVNLITFTEKEAVRPCWDFAFGASVARSVKAQQALNNSGRLRVVVEQVAPGGGNVHIAVHKASDFMQNNRAVTGLILPPLGKKVLNGRLQALPYDTYAVAVYQDMNGNSRLDKNTLGIPTEPYAFANNPKVKWSPPTFEEAAVDIRAEEQTIRVQLRYWRDQ